MLVEELANQRQRTFEPAKKLIEVGSKIHSILNSILIPLYIQLRNSYGVVLYQLHKDFQYN
ncbi:MAG: hypothetical protein UGF89_05230, partial [Acutalibacteraceae bacterium]|nr:hypothetical protein [Acutalibacteraceae bacterium]